MNKKYIIYALYFLLFFSLYYGSVELVQPLKLAAILFLITGILLFNNNLSINKTYMVYIAIIWILSISPFVVSLFYTTNFSASIEFVLLYILTIITFILTMSSKPSIQKYTLDLQYYFSVSIMFFTLMSYFFSSVFEELIMPFLTERAQGTYKYFLELNQLSGVSGQTGTNAYLLSIGLAFLLFKKKDLMNIFMIILFLFSLYMSEKLGIMLANSIAYVSVLLIFKKISYKKLLLLVSIIIASLTVIWRVFALNLIYDLNDFSSGRISLYKEAVNIFKENFLFGTGINTFSSIMSEKSIVYSEGINVHNVYFQLLSEIGLIGFLIFLFVQVTTLISTLRIKNESYNHTTNPEIYPNYVYSIIYIQIFFFVYSFLGNPLYDYNFFFIYLLSIAPVFSIKNWR